MSTFAIIEFEASTPENRRNIEIQCVTYVSRQVLPMCPGKTPRTGYDPARGRGLSDRQTNHGAAWVPGASSTFSLFFFVSGHARQLPALRPKSVTSGSRIGTASSPQ